MHRDKGGDSLWVISHVLPKWFYGLVVVVGLLAGFFVASIWRVQNSATFLVFAAAGVLACVVATHEVDRLLLNRRVHRDAALTWGNLASDPSSLDDGPISFGYKTSWIAVPLQDGRALANCLGLAGIDTCSWNTGIEAAYELRGVFVTPPVLGWTLAVGALPEMGSDGFLQMMETVSNNFRRAYYFGTHRVVEYQAWAFAEDGKIRRAFGWVGESGQFLMNVGERTPEEIELGTGIDDFEHAPDEEMVLDLSARWALDPRELEQKHSESSGPGWFGSRSEWMTTD